MSGRRLFLPAVMAMAVLMVPLDGGEAMAQDMLEDTISVATIFPRERAQEVMRYAVGRFNSMYMDDYLSSTTIYREVRGGGRVMKYFAVDGVTASCAFRQKGVRYPWNDPNKGGLFLPTDAFVSGLVTGGDEVISYGNSIRTKKRGMDYYYIAYSDRIGNDPLAHKRALELEGPLNPERTRCFSYTIERKETRGNGYVYIIGFRNKKASLKDTRIYAEGTIEVSSRGDILGIKARNMEDYFSNYARMKGRLSSVADWTLSVRYAIQGGKVYTSSVEQDVTWRKPSDEGRSWYFHPELPACRNPFAKGVTTNTRFLFGPPTEVGRQEMDRMRHAFREEIYTYVGTPDLERWHSRLDNLASFQKARRDLERESGTGIDEQAVESQAASLENYRQQLRESLADRSKEDSAVERFMKMGTTARAISEKYGLVGQER